MITALFADIHSNAEALAACLDHARTQGAQRFAFVGDLVGYGASPREVVETVAELSAAGAIVVAGNHDSAIAATAPDLDEEARLAIEWTHAALSDEHRKFLASLPLVVQDGDATFVHASADEPGKWKYVDNLMAVCDSIDAAGTTYTFSGHVHDQVLYFRTLAGKTAPFRPTSGSVVPVPSHRRWLALVGSAGQPRDRNPAAAYAMFDYQREEMTFFRVPYDVMSAAAKIRAAGLPGWLAERLERGI